MTVYVLTRQSDGDVIVQGVYRHRDTAEEEQVAVAEELCIDKDEFEIHEEPLI